MENSFTHCFVCGNHQEEMRINKQVNLPVCPACTGSDMEKKALEDLLEGLAEGFICGCI